MAAYSFILSLEKHKTAGKRENKDALHEPSLVRETHKSREHYTKGQQEQLRTFYQKHYSID